MQGDQILNQRKSQWGMCTLLALGLTACVVKAGAAMVQQAGATTSSTNPQASSLLAVPPRSWVVDTVANELIVLHHPGSYLRYRMHVHDEKGDQVRDVIESRDGTVARMILKDGRPLTEAEDTAERERLNAVLTSPSSFARHIKNDENGKKVADELMRLMPDAMIYTYVPGQPQPEGYHGDPAVVMDYEPNPKFKPPTTASEALAGLKGRLWIDSKTRQLIRMEGNVFQGVNFGWGMLAHIYPGGKLVLDQTDAGGGRWIYTRFTEQVSVRALMVKTLNVHSNIEAGEFQVAPGAMTYQDAIHLLLNTPLPTH